MGGSGSTSAEPDAGSPHEESTGTVLLALGANLGIAVAKLVGGLVSGSAAMSPKRRTRSRTRSTRCCCSPG